MHLDNADPLEIGWTLVALVAAAITVALEGRIWASYRVVEVWIEEGRSVPWGPRHRFVVGFLVGVGLLALVWLCLVALGANAAASPPPATPDRAAAGQRGGWILLGLEVLLLLFTCILAAAWLSVGRPTLNPDHAPHSPVALMFRAIELGREMGHTVKNEAQMPVALLDEVAHDERLPADLRSRADEALRAMDRLIDEVGRLHATIRALETSP